VRAHLAILYTPEEDNAPSNAGALKRFEKSARKLGIETEIITREDYGRIPEFDALFIRDNTSVNGYAYRFARRAAAEGLVVIDHPESTFRCNNKVYIAEMLRTNDLPAPRTMIIHRENLDQVEKQIGFPCILKEPDGTFSTGVKKVENEAELQERAAQFLERSELFIGQEFFPTTFDWRIGILDRKLFYAAKYHMAGSHWQIIQYTQTGAYVQAGDVEAIPLRRVPKLVRDTALRAANLIGDGLYGVDVKQRGKECFVIEVNDNPNIDAGCEDQVLGDETYDRIMQTFLKRIEALRRGARR
jgi:glutathione synthase/RimK-type ligase-like ATP-grasp enzyme